MSSKFDSEIKLSSHLTSMNVAVSKVPSQNFTGVFHSPFPQRLNKVVPNEAEHPPCNELLDKVVIVSR